ncbi:polymerase [Zostera-associated varicosavirus 1]|uniref:polymerase n=1 Tax=Zostera-associated varicosavirus 1 TaxID=3071325 RepID=UPI001E6D64A9|nr:polymerase [Zostera-associated varicosavirus 1]DAZ85728.1 TPA_asm: polymerase [Zostera-associated varicosavirus 1]
MLDSDFDFVEDDGTSVQDDPMLIDFHLGNALNLDIVAKLAIGKNPDYSLYTPRFYSNAWESLSTLIPINYEIKVGFLDVTCKLLLGDTHVMTLINQVNWKSISDIVIRALKQRSIDIPITTTNYDLSNMEIFVPKIWLTMFNIILSVISSLSEVLRGGLRTPYAGVASHNSEYVESYLCPGYDITIIVGRNLSAIIDRESKITYIGNYDSVLLLMDTLGQRLCAYIGMKISGPYCVDGVIATKTLLDIIKIGDKILYENGNQGYDIISMYESFVVSIILQKHPDNLSDGRDFYINCIEEALDLCGELPAKERTAELLLQWMNAFSRMSNSELSNIFCIYRIWGHPAVNIKEGMMKVYDKAMTVKSTINLSQDLALCQFRHMFLRNYIAKHRQYPDMTITGEGYIQNCLRCNYPVDHKNGGFVLLDYMGITIGQIWHVPETYDICHILNDKAVSPNRSELFDSISKGKGTIFGTLRRGIIRWMEGDSIRCKEFLDEIDRSGLDEDDLIIGMYEKEREIKVKARMFSLMSERMRMYVVLTEELIANHILPYFPEITMKDPLNVQLRKMWKIGGKGQYENNPNINIDFEKWNLNMRPAFTDALFKQMDKMFGYTHLISRTHSIFQNSYVYSCSGKYLPPLSQFGFLSDPPMAYTGHLGGFEGLRQKGWTVATVCLLAYTAYQLKIDMQLLGQGDNQVIKLYMPVRRWNNLFYTEEARAREAKRLTDEYLQKMRTNFDDAGLPIKVRETWISTRLFMYGKSMYIDGICKPQWLKKLLRSYALSNEGTVTISAVIGTIATNMTASAGVSDAPDVMYLIFLFLAEWSLTYLLHYHPFTRNSIRHSEERFFKMPGENVNKSTGRTDICRLIHSLILIPTAVGGNVTIPLTGFIMRGFPDHASEGYAWINLLRSVPSRYKTMFDNWYSFIKNKTIESDMLIQSPWSINHWKPPTPGLQSRDMVRDWLLQGRFRKNKFLNNMVKIGRTFERKSICKELLSDPINPLITYEVFHSFPQSYYDSILRRFEGTRSVRKLAMRESYTRPIVSRLIEIEERHLSYMIWRSERKGDIFSQCATAQARLARNIGWEREIKGLTTPHPLEYLLSNICHGYNPTCDGSDYILARHDPEGEYPPYLGSRVRTKVISLQDEGARTEPLICANARLARYLKWLKLGENLISVVKLSTEALCDTDVFDNFYDINPGEEGYTGCSEHRFNPAAASDGCFINYFPNLGSRVYMSGDYMPRFGKGKENYTIHFQALYCFLQYISARVTTRASTHHHLSCEECIVPCDDNVSDISSHHPHIDRAFSIEASKLLRETIGFIDKKPTVRESSKEYLALDNDVPFDSGNMHKQHCYNGMIQTLAVKCTLSILSRGSDGDVLGTEDLQSFPRIYSFKIFVDHIMETTAQMLLYVNIMRQNDSLLSVSFFHAKKALLRYLDQAPYVRFKDIASICVGRRSTTEHVRYQIPTGRFPDDAESFTRATKGCLIDTILEMTELQSKLCSLAVIPKLSITEREYKVLVGFYGMIRFRCRDCGGSITRPKEEKFTGDYCSLGHTKKILSLLPLTPASLDRISKIVEIKQKFKYIRKERLPKIGVSSGPYQDHRIPNASNIDTKQFRKINLPTSSIYKWYAVLSNIKEKYEHIIVLGDGTGGTSLTAQSVFPKSYIHPLAKFEKHKMIPQDADSIHPFLSRDAPKVVYDLLESLPDNILDEIWESQFQNSIISLSNNGRVLIISDIEGVNINIIMRKIRTITDLSINIRILIKTYGEELSADLDEIVPYKITSGHANTQYREHFRTSVPMPSRNIGQCKYKILEEQKRIERSFPQALSLSWVLSRQKLAVLGLSIGKDLLMREPGRIMVAVLGHINSRYRFPQDKIRAYDPRNLTDGTLVRLVRAIRIIIGSFLTESSMTGWYHQLSLARFPKIKGIHPVLRKRINIVIDVNSNIISDHEDYLVMRTIRGFRRQTYTMDGYRELADIIYLNLDNPHISQDADEITDTDSIETVSDLSYE